MASQPGNAGGSGGLASIFKRGGSKTELRGGPVAGGAAAASGASDAARLEQHLQQLSVAWAAPKTKKGLAAAVWRPAVGAFEVVNRGRQTFNGIGFMHSKKLYLNIEEAVFMMDRAGAVLLLEQQQQQRNLEQQQDASAPLQRLLSMQEALHMMVQLGVHSDRLLVLSHLSRLGFSVRRHPAVWTVPPHLTPAAVWQANPAWAHTDGLPPPMAALPAPQQPSLALPSSGGASGSAPPAAAAAAATAGGSKRRKVEVAAQQQPAPPRQAAWFAPTPPWLQQHAGADAGSAAAAAAAAGGTAVEPPELLGLQLQRRFPLLAPLPTYAGGAGGGGSDARSSAATAELVFDALATQPHFSYKAPPPLQFAIALVAPGCPNLPPLDELLALSAAAGASLPAARGGGAPAHGDGGAVFAPVQFALPEGGDVGFCELQPVQLMNLLTNQP